MGMPTVDNSIVDWHMLLCLETIIVESKTVLDQLSGYREFIDASVTGA